MKCYVFLTFEEKNINFVHFPMLFSNIKRNVILNEINWINKLTGNVCFIFSKFSFSLPGFDSGSSNCRLDALTTRIQGTCQYLTNTMHWICYGTIFSNECRFFWKIPIIIIEVTVKTQSSYIKLNNIILIFNNIIIFISSSFKSIRPTIW